MNYRNIGKGLDDFDLTVFSIFFLLLLAVLSLGVTLSFTEGKQEGLLVLIPIIYITCQVWYVFYKQVKYNELHS